MVLLGTVTGLALQGCMSVQVRVDPAPAAPAEPTSYYGVVERPDVSSSIEQPAYETWEDCWLS